MKILRSLNEEKLNLLKDELDSLVEMCILDFVSRYYILSAYATYDNNKRKMLNYFIFLYRKNIIKRQTTVKYLQSYFINNNLL